MQAEGSITELILSDGQLSARLRCPAGLVPAAGQYLLAHAAGSDAPLATAVFSASIVPGGFITAPPIPSAWTPGARLYLRGPLGHGFKLPPSARRIALVPFECSPRSLLALLHPAFQQDASVTLVSEMAPDDLPFQVEVQPLRAWLDVCKWADYFALDVARASLPIFKEKFHAARYELKAQAQALVRTPMPCGAMAGCGVCTVDVGGLQILACEDGPVFDLGQLMGWSSKA